MSACIPVGHLYQTSSTDGNILWSMIPLIPPNLIHLDFFFKKVNSGNCCHGAHVRGVMQEGSGHEELLQEPQHIFKNAHLFDFFWFCNPSHR